MADMIGGGRPQRLCVRCRAVDDHPRCIEDDGTDKPDDLYHLDCHRELRGDMGCHSGPEHRGVGELTGPALLDDMLAAAAEHYTTDGAN